jgi:hypothetical protein
VFVPRLHQGALREWTEGEQRSKQEAQSSGSSSSSSQQQPASKQSPSKKGKKSGNAAASSSSSAVKKEEPSDGEDAGAGAGAGFGSSGFGASSGGGSSKGDRVMVGSCRTDFAMTRELVEAINREEENTFAAWVDTNASPAVSAQGMEATVLRRGNRVAGAVPKPLIKKEKKEAKEAKDQQLSKENKALEDFDNEQPANEDTATTTLLAHPVMHPLRSKGKREVMRYAGLGLVLDVRTPPSLP